MSDKNEIEIELRGILTEVQYRNLIDFFRKNAEDLGEDNRKTVFFIIPDATLKVAKNVSKNRAKIALKVGNIKTGKQEEIEIPIDSQDFEKAVRMFQALDFNEIQYTSQKRHNFLYEGVEFAIKHSEHWGYHFEAEIVVDDENKVTGAKRRIEEICRKLSLKPLTEQEIKEMCEKIDAQHREKSKNEKGTAL